MVIILFFGCQRKLIKTEEILFIKIKSIHQNIEEFPGSTKVFYDEAIIKKISGILNGANKEPVKFIPQYEIQLVFKNNDVTTILVRNNLLNIQGNTYRLKENLGEIIEKVE